MHRSTKHKIFGALSAAVLTLGSYAQVSSTSQLNGGINTITTAVPLLLITPDSRAGGLADCGVASSPDANSVHWNASKLAFADKKLALGVSYTPWLRQLVNDINLAYLAGYYKLDKNSAVTAITPLFLIGKYHFH